jgi:hypothetical protein
LRVGQALAAMFAGEDRDVGEYRMRWMAPQRFGGTVASL